MIFQSTLNQFSERSQTHGGDIQFPTHEGNRWIYRQEIVWWLQRGNGELAFNRCRISIWEAEKIPKVDGADGRTTMSMYWIPLDYTHRTSQNGKFCFRHIFIIIKQSRGDLPPLQMRKLRLQEMN
jgi:hypothetical protein